MKISFHGCHDRRAQDCIRYYTVVISQYGTKNIRQDRLIIFLNKIYIESLFSSSDPIISTDLMILHDCRVKRCRFKIIRHPFLMKRHPLPIVLNPLGKHVDILLDSANGLLLTTWCMCCTKNTVEQALSGHWLENYWNLFSKLLELIFLVKLL